MLDVAALLKGAQWNKRQPADPVAVDVLAPASQRQLPEAYLALLLYSDGGEGGLAIEPGWFQLWPAAKVMERNKAYEVDKALPHFFGFGSNGGDELLAFDFRERGSCRVAMIPFVPMTESEAVVIADNFEAFVRAIGRPCSPD